TYLAVPLVMVTTMEKPFTESIDQLNGKKVGVVKGYATFERLKKLYPSLNIIEVKSVNDGLKKVESGQLYGYIDNLVVTSSYIQKEYAGSLKVSSRLDEKDELHVAVHNDEPMMYAIFEKLVLELDDLTLQKSYNRWTSTIEQVAWFDRALVGKIVFVILLFLVAFIWRYALLKRYNSRLLKLSTTDKLTGLYNRQKTDEKLNEEQKKVNRYLDYHCSIMMIDVDLFKTINDTLGHQEGDKVLQNMADVMKKSLRQTDAIGRWGGEEFIVILSHTPLEEALNVAEHLRSKVAESPFIPLHPVTVSIGVGEFTYTEEVHECVARIDAALYKAKENGRNGVVSTF
ncbi:MAG TPA: GGDEF domain-containing protein, partial [Sulfuricurvum sp.]|nr:GGDEF domain-containing protein [Sulfuricurvum sp.]